MKLLFYFMALLLLISPVLASEPRIPYIASFSIDSIDCDPSGNPIITDAGCIIWTNATIHYRYGFSNVDNVFVTLTNESGSTIAYEFCNLTQYSTSEGYATNMLNFGSYQPAGNYVLKYQVEYIDISGSDARQYISQSFTCNKSVSISIPDPIQETEPKSTVIETTEYEPIFTHSRQAEPEPTAEPGQEGEEETTLPIEFIAVIVAAVLIILFSSINRNKEE